MTIKVGDRVKVEFEGIIAPNQDTDAHQLFVAPIGGFFDGSDYLVDSENVTVIPQPIVLPTEHGYYESKRRQLWVHNEDGWYRGGVGSPVHATSLLADHAPFRRLVLDLPDTSE